MLHREETSAPVVAPIVTGHFREVPGYATWRTRGTSDFLLMLTLGGHGRVGWDGGQHITEAGDVVLLRPGTRHDYGTARGAHGWELLWTHFLPRQHWLDWLVWPEAAAGIGHLALGSAGAGVERVASSLWEMHRRATSGLPRREEFAMNALEEALLWCDSVNPHSAQARLDPRVVQAMEYLREDLRRPFALPAVASAAGLSVSRLAHLFRAQVGQTPQQFIERERITRARQLLSLTSRTIAAVAEEVGFENPFYFTLRFKKHTGVSPRDWRRQQGRD